MTLNNSGGSPSITCDIWTIFWESLVWGFYLDCQRLKGPKTDVFFKIHTRLVSDLWDYEKDTFSTPVFFCNSVLIWNPRTHSDPHAIDALHVPFCAVNKQIQGKQSRHSPTPSGFTVQKSAYNWLCLNLFSMLWLCAIHTCTVSVPQHCFLNGSSYVGHFEDCRDEGMDHLETVEHVTMIRPQNCFIRWIPGWTEPTIV